MVTILPNAFQGALGDHGEDMPIENLRLSHDKKYLVSSGHDDKLQFWDVAHLFMEEAEAAAIATEEADEAVVDDKENGDEVTPQQDSDDGWGTDSDDEKEKKKRKKTQKKMKAEKKKDIKTTAFFADM